MNQQSSTQQDAAAFGRIGASSKLAGIITRATSDADFRTQLLTAPKQTIEAVTGTKVGDDVSIGFIDGKTATTFVLPAYVGASADLSEDELAAVAGGSPDTETALLAAGAMVGALCAVDVAAKAVIKGLDWLISQ